MARPWAKIVVERTVDSYFRLCLHSDFGELKVAGSGYPLLDVVWGWQQALARARAWSRRLGDILVEVGGDT